MWCIFCLKTSHYGYTNKLQSLYAGQRAQDKPPQDEQRAEDEPPQDGQRAQEEPPQDGQRAQNLLFTPHT